MDETKDTTELLLPCDDNSKVSKSKMQKFLNMDTKYEVHIPVMKSDVKVTNKGHQGQGHVSTNSRMSYLYEARYWMSMVSTMMCLVSFVYCALCFSGEHISSMADESSSQVLALEISARKVILDLGVLTLTIAIGFLLFLSENRLYKKTDTTEGDPKALDTSGGMLSSILVAYKLFQMIVAVDISVRLLQGLQLTLIIVDLHFIHLLVLFVLPVFAASIEVTMTVAMFTELQYAFRDSHHAKIINIS